MNNKNWNFFQLGPLVNDINIIKFKKMPFDFWKKLVFIKIKCSRRHIFVIFGLNRSKSTKTIYNSIELLESIRKIINES